MFTNTNPLFSTLVIGIWSKLQADTWTWGNLDNAADMLYYYLVNSYSEIILNDSDMKEIISCHDNNTLHLKYNIDQLMSVAEQTTYNNSNVICTTADSNMRVVCMVDRECECELAGTNINGQIHPNCICRLDTAKQADWNLAVGSSYGGMVANVTSNGETYTINYRYYLLDIYEWAAHVNDPDDLSLMMHRLHEIGLSHQYLITGYFEGTLTWEKGERTANQNIMDQINSTLGI